MKDMSDIELMERIRCGDFAAFDELYNRYSGVIRKFLFSLTWDMDKAEDYLQEVFLRLYQARERYQPMGKFTTYLFQIAKNYYLSQRRKEKKAADLSLDDEPRDGFKPFGSIKASARVEPEVHLMIEYQRFNIRRAIDALPEAQKLVFVMSHFENMKYAEIAEVLDVPVGTVKSRMFAAVNALRSLLKEEQK